MYEAAKTAAVLERDQLEQIRPFLESIQPMPAVFSQQYVKRLSGKSREEGQAPSAIWRSRCATTSRRSRARPIAR